MDVLLQLSFVNFKKGTYLFIDGAETNDRFYIIQSGKVECTSSIDQANGAKKILTTGDFVGVIPCMASRGQIENSLAITDVKCISVQREQYPDLIEKNIPVALKIIRTFSKRMRELNERFTQVSAQKASQDAPEHIFEVAQYYDSEGRRDIAAYAYYQYMKECPHGAHIEEVRERFLALKKLASPVYLDPDSSPLRKYPVETMIMSENQSGAEMFVIQSGQVTISKVVDGKEVVLAVLKKGDMFGEMALLENKPRSATAIAHQDCTLMVVSRANFDQMVGSQPQLIARLTTTLADRLWAMYRQQGNAALPDGASKVIDMLALQLEKSRHTDGSFQTDYSIDDLITMSSISPEFYQKAVADFQKEKFIRINNNMVYVTDCAEIIKLSRFLRKKEAQDDLKL